MGCFGLSLLRHFGSSLEKLKLKAFEVKLRNFVENDMWVVLVLIYNVVSSVEKICLKNFKC